MPTYDYKCQKCEGVFETIQGINDPHFTKCPACGKEALKRLIGTGGVLKFNGTGFYETDFKHK
jgi:putative FmdB family regulatory protein